LRTRRARSIGDRYAEFLDRVQAYAYFPYTVAKDVADFRNGEISVRFEGISGRIDQGAGILFNLKTNGDYLTVRANPLENNLVLRKARCAELLNETLFRSLAHARRISRPVQSAGTLSRQEHSRLGWMSPAIYAAARRSAALRSTDGSAPRTAAITAQEGITERQTPIAAG
jgi:hypothetical protein